ncbi:hypothetical protein DL546_000861 [Coniochaeta pulveracea]|nr:hypothetical protein DL546_000861 [Coniochaeta pulveracea]
MSQEPTLSHALALDDHDEKGLAQQDHDHEVLDLGWNEEKKNIPAPLVGGLQNEDLWMLVRRFNKQIWHVKATVLPPPGGLDLQNADQQEFTPDKFRAQIERLYMTVIVSLLGVYNHIARLRSWRERKRTAGFAAAYFIAWAFDFIVPLLTGTIVVLITYPPSRSFLFPPAPIALVNTSTGGIQKPRAGVLGSHDSATGAPENHKGEAVEKEANNFVTGIASVAVSSATSGGTIPEARHEDDKTKVPVETAMWTKMTPIMNILSDFLDGWERFANALSPTAPFPQETSRLRIAALVVPLFGVSLFVTSYMFVKGVTFGIGFGFFGDPVISASMDWLNKAYPNWQKLLELRNTLLKGVPTNAQLTLTLLRLGEAHNAPIPPPPRITEPAPNKPKELTTEHLDSTGEEMPLGATPAEIQNAVEFDPRVPHELSQSDHAAYEKLSHGKKKSRLLGIFRGGVRGMVKTAIGGDHLRAKATGAQPAKDRLGALPAKDDPLISGPVEFKARYDGKKGHVYITKKATIPAIGFSIEDSTKIKDRLGIENDELRPIWSVAIADIVEMKKIGGYGWKSKIVIGWAMGREVADGLEITTRAGEKYKITAIPLRDELFNRLVAMGGQKWVSW